MTFNTIEDDITIILKNSKAARCDDMVLYAAYVSNKLSENTSFLHSMLYRVFIEPEFRISHGIATYGSVSRVRRKLQEEYPELKAPRAVIEEKKELEKNYRAYAKGVKK